MASKDVLVALPMSFVLSAILLGFYLVVFLLILFTGMLSGSESFASRWWWLLILVRIAGASAGFGATYKKPLPPDLSAQYAINWLYDIGTLFIVMSILRTSFMISENKNLCLFSITRRILGFLLFALLNVGWILQLILAGSEQSPSLDQIGHTCHGMAITLLAITLGLASVLTVKPFLARWSSRSHFNHSNWVQSLAVYITFILLAIRIIPDLLRVWTRRSLTNLSYILTGMVPEFFIVCGWIWLGRGICRWDRRFKKLGHKAPEILRRMWFGWKILEYEKRYLERDTSIYSTISSSLVLPDKPQTCSIEVPGLLDYIEYFTSYDLVQRQEKLLARPGILAAAEKLMPNLASPSPLGGLNTGAYGRNFGPEAQRLQNSLFRARYFFQERSLPTRRVSFRAGSLFNLHDHSFETTEIS